MQRILVFYKNNKQKKCLIAQERIKLLLGRIFPSAKELKKILRGNRGNLKPNHLCVFYMVLKILEDCGADHLQLGVELF